MKILFITHYSELYGANRSLINLLEYGKSSIAGFEPRVIMPNRGPLAQILKELNIPFSVVRYHYSHVSNQSSTYFRIRTFISFCLSIYRLHQVKNLASYDLIYSNSSVIAHGLVLSKMLRKKHIWHFREYGFEHYNLVPLWGGTIQRKLIKKSDALLFVSRDLAQKQVSWNSKTQIQRVIYNGVFSENDPPENCRIMSSISELRICFAGLMAEKKMALEALKLLEHLHAMNLKASLVICAEMKGTYAQRFQQEVKDRQLEKHVQYLGFVEDVRTVLKDCHFLIVPSRYEAMGRVSVEAMSCGTPVIGYESGGTAELYTHGESGIYYRAISEAANYLKNLSQADYHQMCEQARIKALADFSIEKYGSAVFEVFYHIMAKN